MISPADVETVSTRQVSGTAEIEIESNHGQSDVQLEEGAVSPRQYKVYKRRFLGLIQLVLLNIVVSWDVCRHSL